MFFAVTVSRDGVVIATYEIDADDHIEAIREGSEKFRESDPKGGMEYLTIQALAIN